MPAAGMCQPAAGLKLSYKPMGDGNRNKETGATEGCNAPSLLGVDGL